MTGLMDGRMDAGVGWGKKAALAFLAQTGQLYGGKKTLLCWPAPTGHRLTGTVPGMPVGQSTPG